MPDFTLNGYVVEEVLGTGSFGEVLLVTKVRCNSSDINNDSNNDNIGRKLVIKKIPNERMKFAEVEAGRLLSHPNIVTFYEHFQDKDYHYLVLEYVRGIDLFAFMESRNLQGLPEEMARKIFSQISSAIQYCHQKGVAHRDLKLENILIDPSTLYVKLIDFGLCKIGDEACSDVCGSVDYIAPEILSEKPHYSPKKTDIWCLGTILYCLLFANFPFSSEERIDALVPEPGQPVKPHPPIDFPKSAFISREARDLCERMMTVDPNRRISLSAVMSHKWMTVGTTDNNNKSSNRKVEGSSPTRTTSLVSAIKPTKGEELEEAHKPQSDAADTSTTPTTTSTHINNNFSEIVNQICKNFGENLAVAAATTTPTAPTIATTTTLPTTTTAPQPNIHSHVSDGVQRDCGREMHVCLQGCGSSRCQHFAVRSPV